MRTVILTLVLLCLGSQGALAEDRPGYSGGGGTLAYISPEHAVVSQAKSAFFTGYYEHRRAGGSPLDFKDLSELEALLGVTLALDTTSPQAYPAYNVAKTLNVSFQNQMNNYYCGPASAWAAMNWLGIGNNYFGAPLTQPNLATSFWLETETYGGTPRGENWRKTLNGWVDGTNDGWYVVHTYGYAAADDVAGKFAANIDNNYVPIMNVYMNDTRGWLPSWQGDGYAWAEHYVPGFGYGQYGDYLHYIEVFAAVGSGYYYNVTKERFAAFVSGYGMIW